MFRINPDKCTLCGECMDACPCASIEEQDGHCVIDEYSCADCAACFDVCEFEAIEEIPFKQE